MNRAQRRQQERQQKKAQQQKGAVHMEMEMIQPWSDVLMRVKLPDEVVDGMVDITDQILQNPDRKNWGDNLAGQIADEPLIPHEMMQNYKIGSGQNEGTIFNFLMNAIGEYIKSCSLQQATMSHREQVENVQWLTQMKSA